LGNYSIATDKRQEDPGQEREAAVVFSRKKAALKSWGDIHAVEILWWETELAT
jgi:hypothetical protein